MEALSIIAGLALLLAGYQWLFGDAVPRTQLQRYQLISQQQANANSATLVDVLFIYDSALAEQLPKAVPQWLQQRQQLLLSHSQMLEHISYQIPPGQVLPVYALTSAQQRAQQVWLYANYLDAGSQQAMDVTDYQSLQITLTPDAVVLQEGIP